MKKSELEELVKSQGDGLNKFLKIIDSLEEKNKELKSRVMDIPKGMLIDDIKIGRDKKSFTITYSNCRAF